ncbi:MAG: pyrroline-5-carboxylate reductase [Actinomycetota bacterium]|nr:pyrroline-5-carboxylate reductase [Actinomycetota bacterium]
MVRPTVAILGAGAIGEALTVGLLAAGWQPQELTLAARRSERAAAVEERTAVRTLLDAADAASGKDVVVVSVKPRDVPQLLSQVAGHIRPQQVVLSLAAGVPTTVFEERLPDVPVVRAMPNTPALVGEGITAYAAGRQADDQALRRAEEVLESVGSSVRLDEQLLDAVTAVSGTGPAYLFLLAEALIEAAVREGLPRDVAERLVDQTVKGSGVLLVETGLTASELRAQVTSPGGTTAAAVHVLEERGFRALVEDAVRAAARRSRELGAAASSTGDLQGV